MSQVADRSSPQVLEHVAQAQDLLKDRATAYKLAFSSPAGKAVLEDLTKFCRGMETIFDKDPRVQDVLIGRNEVWRRIQEHLNLSVAELYRRYA